MSGEAVVVTAVASPVGLAVVAAAAAVVVAGSLAARAIEAEKQRRIKEAWRQQQQEIRRLASLKRFRRQCEEREQQRARYEQTLLRLAACKQPEDESTSGGAAMQSYIASDDHQRLMLDELARILEATPAALRQQADSPLSRLQTRIEQLQQQYMQGKTLDDALLQQLHTTLENTIRLQLQQHETAQAMLQQMQQQAESLLQTIISYRHQTENDKWQTELITLQRHVEQWLQGDEHHPATLDTLTAKMDALKAAIDAVQQAQATRLVLQQRIRLHLEDMGYQWLADEGNSHQLWRIPGGERVSLAVQHDFRIGFQLQHERAGELADGEELNQQESRFLRQQESRWCGDLRQLIRQLVADGFQYSLQFERELPQDSVPVVVVDDAASWEREAAEARGDAPQARRLS